MITMGNSGMPPDDPNLLGRLLISLIEMLSSPDDSKKRIADYAAAHKVAVDAIQRAKKDVEEAAKAKQNAEREIADARAKFDSDSRHAADLHRQKMDREAAATAADRTAAARARAEAEAASEAAAALKAELVGKLEKLKALATESP
jgi:hypothetical protein